MSNRFFVIVLAVIAIFFGIFFFTKNNNKTTGNDSVQATNHVKGGAKTPVVFMEYGDFQCPACGAYFPMVQQVYAKYKDDITFQFRHFPLVQIHRNAFAAHRAAEAAAKQNKFWEMHDQLYQTQDAWKDSSDPANIFIGYARQLGLDVEQFKTDMSSAEVNDIINADIKEGQNLGATSTPTFVIDGKRLEKNPQSVEEFSKLIDDAIASSKN